MKGLSEKVVQKYIRRIQTPGLDLASLHLYVSDGLRYVGADAYIDYFRTYPCPILASKLIQYRWDSRGSTPIQVPEDLSSLLCSSVRQRQTHKPLYTVVLIGGHGGLPYQDVATKHRCDLIIHEKRVREGTLVLADLVLIAITRCGHALREKAARLASAHKVPFVYLKSDSLTAVDQVLSSRFPTVP